MYRTVDELADLAVQKAEMRRGAQFLGAMLAGAYVGVAILLIFTLGNLVPLSARALVMGCSFGLALVLVVFAGSELFTGYVMYCGFGIALRKLAVSKGLKISAWVWLGNLAGAVCLVGVYWMGKGYLLQPDGAELLQNVAAKKMSLSPSVAFARGMLCNWLVCLALWCAKRVDSDTARLLVISWCLLAFIASGYEHSVANMTVHAVALIGPEDSGVSIHGAVHNLFWVSLGNIAGALFAMVLPYFLIYRNSKVA